MTVIDLTNGRNPVGPKVGMFTRFPPSKSGSAPSASILAEHLNSRFGIPVEVIRLVMPGESSAEGHPVIMDLNPRWHMSAQFAAQRANRCDVALIQIDCHISLGLMESFIAELTVPVVLSVDDVVGSADASALARLAEKVAVIVVPSEVGRRRLEAAALPAARIEVIPHGSSLQAMEPRPLPRRQIITWGFMEPGMGAERVVRALPLLDDLDPPPRYRLIGVADPFWTRSEASSYRSSLSAEAVRLGVADQIEFVPMLHSRAKLASEIEQSDLIVVAYDATERACSRILTEAVSTGRPVVATAFPGAIEMLASGAGTTVAHDSVEDMAGAIRMYLTDDDEYRKAARLATALSPGLGWDETARKFAKMILDVVDSSELVNETRL
ncbi:MAG TPA: glycosyltransferase [Acidimicrobiia bacterium]